MTMLCKKKIIGLALLLIFIPWIANGQSPEGSVPSETNIRNAAYPRITPDKRVLFRVRAPQAEVVKVRIGPGYNMEKDAQGFWSVTTDPIRPGFHGYSFEIDGVSVNDPGTETYFTGGRWTSAVEIPEDGVRFFDLKDVPHGDIRKVNYYSTEKKDWRRLYIYTPPGYDKDTHKTYPTLYIQHGAGEDEHGWWMQGKLDLILDNLIAEGKAVPMIAVMSDDYLEDNIGRGYNSPTTNVFFDRFGRDLIGDIIPFIEKNYRAIPHRESRAMAGLSMGAGITFRIGLNNPEVFSHVGVFSTSAFRGQGDDIFDIEAQVPGLLSDPERFNKNLNVFYISNGEQDGSFNYTIKTVEKLREHGVNVHLKTFPGAHEWHVWRKALHDFAPLLFKRK